MLNPRERRGTLARIYPSSSSIPMSFSASREADGTRGVGPGGAAGWMVLTPSFLLQGTHAFAPVHNKKGHGTHRSLM